MHKDQGQISPTILQRSTRSLGTLLFRRCSRHISASKPLCPLQKDSNLLFPKLHKYRSVEKALLLQSLYSLLGLHKSWRLFQQQPNTHGLLPNKAFPLVHIARIVALGLGRIADDWTDIPDFSNHNFESIGFEKLIVWLDNRRIDDSSWSLMFR